MKLVTSSPECAASIERTTFICDWVLQERLVLATVWRLQYCPQTQLYHPA